jgi:WD40 repeat protein
VNDARFSPDGKLIVTASADGTAAVWRVADGQRLQTLTGHTDPVVAATFSPNGNLVATASADDTARIFDVSSGNTEHVLRGHTSGVTAVAFSPDGSRLATASLDDDARVWNVRTGNEIALLRIHQGLVSDVAFSADGRWLATAGPGKAGIWRAPKTGAWPARPLYLVSGQTKPINDLAFSPRGWRLLTGGNDGSVRMFDCTACTGVNGLVKLARARLSEIVRVKR